MQTKLISFLRIHRKVEIEQKRKLEEMERRRQEQEDLRAAVALQVRLFCGI